MKVIITIILYMLALPTMANDELDPYGIGSGSREYRQRLEASANADEAQSLQQEANDISREQLQVQRRLLQVEQLELLFDDD